MNEPGIPPTLLPVEWGVAAHTAPGETQSGDRHLVKPFPGGVLVAVVDGLGHGDPAAAAAEAAIAALEEHAEQPVDHLLKHCHMSLRRSRGVVMSLASFPQDASHNPALSLQSTMTWLGVGNVKGVLVRASSNNLPQNNRGRSRFGGRLSRTPGVRPSTTGDDLVAYEWLLLRSGVVGYNLPSLRPVVVSIKPGDTLILVTDGIRSSFAQSFPHTQNGPPPQTQGEPQQVADAILVQYSRETDDALVLVVRYTGQVGR